jgi:hypothetical protein
MRSRVSRASRAMPSWRAVSHVGLVLSWAVVGPDGAGLMPAGPPAGLVAHELVDDPDRDAGVLEPGREGMGGSRGRRAGRPPPAGGTGCLTGESIVACADRWRRRRPLRVRPGRGRCWPSRQFGPGCSPGRRAGRPPLTEALGKRLPAHAPSGRRMVRSAVRPTPLPTVPRSCSDDTRALDCP